MLMREDGLARTFCVRDLSRSKNRNFARHPEVRAAPAPIAQ
jgi:hypothetical protein